MIYRILPTFLAGLSLAVCLAFPVVAKPADGPFAAGNRSFSFLENTGQITDQYSQPRPDIDFKISSHGVNTFIGSGGIHYQWARPVNTDGQTLAEGKEHGFTPASVIHTDQPQPWTMYRMDVSLVGANKNALLIKEDKQDYYERYYLPQGGPQGTTASSYQKLTYKNVYPNIDWVLYVQDGHMKYDFVVHPGGKVSDIRLQYGGATSLKPDQAGGITATTPLGMLTEKAPISFQGDGTEVASRFILTDHTLSFAVDPYEGKLIIDPTLEWGTYYGDMASVYEVASDLAYDAFQGDGVYFCGMTVNVSNIATTGAYQASFAGVADAYLVKFNGAGVRQWGTYFGGAKTDGQAARIVCDTLGYIYLTGITRSPSNIATPGSFQDTLSGYAADSNASDNFLVKFDPSGNRLWATYYGGDEHDDGASIICDDSGNVYIAGITESASGIATGSGQQNTLNGGQDVFIAKFDPAGLRQWATYYGGVEDESFPNICYGSEKIFLSASTFSLSDIATPGAYQSTNNATYPIWGTVFLAEFSRDSGLRNWATYYGGTKAEGTTGIAYDDHGYLYICGVTASDTGIATPGSHDDTFDWIGLLAFLSKFCVTPDLSGYDLDITGADSLCMNGSATYSIPAIEAVTAYIWTLPAGWSGSSDSTSIDITSGSTGGLIGVQIVRCEDTSAMQSYEVYVFPPDPAIITVDGFVLGTVDASYTSYQWLYNDTLIPGATGSTYAVTANGDYKVITTNQRGCVDTSAAYTVKNYTGIADRNLANSVKIFPNPARDLVTLQAPVPVNVLLSGMEGRLLLNQHDARSMNISHLAPGVYVLRILDQKGTLLKTEQLVKMAK